MLPIIDSSAIEYLLIVIKYIFELLIQILIDCSLTSSSCIVNRSISPLIIYNVNVSLIVPSNLCHIYNRLLLFGSNLISKIKLQYLHITPNNVLLNVVYYVCWVRVECLIPHFHHVIIRTCSFIVSMLRSIRDWSWRLRVLSVSICLLLALIFLYLLSIHATMSIEFTR